MQNDTLFTSKKQRQKDELDEWKGRYTIWERGNTDGRESFCSETNTGKRRERLRKEWAMKRKMTEQGELQREYLRKDANVMRAVEGKDDRGTRKNEERRRRWKDSAKEDKRRKTEEEKRRRTRIGMRGEWGDDRRGDMGSERKKMRGRGWGCCSST